ncbi:MAG: succinate dehydrogenase, hydrophobic membrane anchor protein [Chromatiales bacterium]|nr:succinate dehydrogenase, hydrophobic membrane anchor protein [Chromatiales bacterium]
MSSHHLSGLTAWLVQRLSAVYMALFVVAMTAVVVSHPGYDYASWRALFAQPLVAVTTSIFFISLLLHIWVGIRDIILDYVGGSPSMRLLLLSLLGVWLIAMGIWIVRIMLRVMLI